MATFVLTDPTILLGGVDLTSKSHQLSLTYEVEAVDATVFGNDTRINKAGLFVVSAEIGGYVDQAITDDDIFNAVGAGPSVLQVADTSDDGASGYAFRSMASSHQPMGGAVGDMASDSVSLVGKSGSPLVAGTILLPPSTARTSSSTGTGRQLGAVASDEKVFGALNVVAASGSSPTLDVTVESDDNSGFTSATTRLTFAQQTVAGDDWQSADGAITDDWWRVNYTIGGSSPSFTFQILVGIR